MVQCPICKLSMDSHSTNELVDCCMEQMGREHYLDSDDKCPNCKHSIEDHTNQGLAECTIAYLKSKEPE